MIFLCCGSNALFKLSGLDGLVLGLILHQVPAYNLRSSTAPVFYTPRESETFQHSAATLFNRLPISTRNILDHNVFFATVLRNICLLSISLEFT